MMRGAPDKEDKMTLNELLPIIAIPLVIILVLVAVFSMWKKVPQDKAGVITGLKRRVITGGGGLVIPGVERIDYISLGNMPLRVDTRGSLSSQGVPISVSTTAVIKVRNSPDAILTAIEQFTGKNEQEIIKNIMSTATAVLEGKLREIIATMTVEDLYQKREAFSSQVQEVVGTELGNMGLEVKNFTITDISDENGYIEALGEGMIAQRKKDAEIQKSEAKREQDERTSENIKIGEQAKLEAATAIKQAEKEKQVAEARYQKEISTANAEAELAHDIQRKKTQKEVIQAEMDAELIRQQRQKDIAEAEIQVQITQAQKNTELAQQRALEKEKQLLSDVVKPAEAGRKRLEQESEADKYAQIKKAEAEAEKKKIDALAEAEAIKARAVAEAQAIEAKAKAEAEAIARKGNAQAEAKKASLLAEAEGLERKAEAMQKLNSAGVIQMVIDKLPEMASAVAQPLTAIDKISIIDSGSGESGVSQMGSYVPSLLAKTMETVKETTGFDMLDAMKANTIQAQTERKIQVEGLSGGQDSSSPDLER
jgi:flotillin